MLLEAGWAGYSETGIKISLFGTKVGVELVKIGGVLRKDAQFVSKLLKKQMDILLKSIPYFRKFIRSGKIHFQDL